MFPIVLVVINSVFLFFKLFTLKSGCLLVLVYSTKSHVGLPGLHFAAKLMMIDNLLAAFDFFIFGIDHMRLHLYVHSFGLNLVKRFCS